MSELQFYSIAASTFLKHCFLFKVSISNVTIKKNTPATKGL